MQAPIYEVFIIEDKLDYLFLSLVDEPAIEENFIYFNKEKEILTFVDDKMIVKGPAIIPGLKIPRMNNGELYYTFFSEDTTRRFAELFLNNKKQNKINLMHKDIYFDASIIESYFANTDNEFNVPEGSWIVSLKINDENVWKMIKEGKLQGFSVQAMFGKYLVFKKEEKNKMELKDKLFAAISSVLFSEETKTDEKSEEFVAVESDVVEEVVENVVEETAMIVEESAPEVLTIEMVKTLLLELENKIKESIMGQLQPINEEVNEFKKSVNEKIEAFSNQEIKNVSVKEEITTGVKINDNPAVKYFVKK